MARQAGLSALALAAALLLAGSAQAAPPTGAELQEALGREGPQALIAAHFDPDRGDGYAAIEQGSPEAIRVAVALLEGNASGEVTLALRSALATALQVHPEEVLPLVDTHPALGANAICVPYLPFDKPVETLQAMLDRTRAALATPAAEAFSHQARECREVLAGRAASLRKRRTK